MLKVFSLKLCLTLLTASGAAAVLYIQVNLLAASMFPGESKAPLIITLLVTTAASAIVSMLMSSVQNDVIDDDARHSKTVAAFVFINASASFVGLLSNLLESIEFVEPAGPNGLTWILEVFFREEQAPLLPYVIVLVAVLFPVAWMLFAGAGLLISRDQWTEQKIGVIESLSFALFLVWIAIGTKWKTVPFGAEAIASFWTIAVYSIVALTSVWIYGRVLFHGLKIAPKFIDGLGRGFLQIFLNWRLWVSLIAGTVIVMTGFLLALVVASFLNQILIYLLRLFGVLGNTATEEISRVLSVIGEVARGEALLIGAILCGWFLAALLLILIAKIHSGILSKLQMNRGLSWRGVLESFVSAWLSIFRLIVALSKGLRLILVLFLRQKIAWQFACAILLVSMLSGDSLVSVEGLKSERLRIVVLPAGEDPLPVSSVVQVNQSPIQATISNVDFCSGPMSTFGWRFGSSDTIEQSADACLDASGSMSGETVSILVAVSSHGPYPLKEERRSYARALKLAAWAIRSFDDTSSVYILDLGMSRSTDLAEKLRPLVGATTSKRPIGGFSVVSVDERAIRGQLLELALLKIADANLKEEFSKCDLYKIGSRRLVLTELKPCELR